jgi:hypothetical protein
MSTVTVELEGFEQISSALGRNRTLVLGTLNRALRRVGTHMVPALKARTPVRTGKLRASTRYQIKGTAEDMRMEVRQGARTAGGVLYRPFVTEGTRPHEIRPVNARALRIVIGGDVVFASRVQHPGTKANPYHRRTLREEQPEIRRIAKEEADRLAARLLD